MPTTHKSRFRHAALAALCTLLPAAGAAAQIVPDLTRRAQPKPTALAGLWNGTAEETTDAGRVRFPVELRFSGSPAELGLEVRARGKVDAGDGTQLTFTVHATYTGALSDGEIRMRSEKVETRIVEYDEVIPSAPQTLIARLADGELRAAIA